MQIFLPPRVAPCWTLRALLVRLPAGPVVAQSLDRAFPRSTLGNFDLAVSGYLDRGTELADDGVRIVKRSVGGGLSIVFTAKEVGRLAKLRVFAGGFE